MQHEDNTNSLKSTADLFIMPMLFIFAMISFVALISLI